MNIYKLFPILGFLLLIIVIDCGDGTYLFGLGHHHHLAYGAAALLPATALLAPYALSASPGIVFLLLLHILGFQAKLLLGHLLAFGALIIAKGTSLLLGASIGNIGTLYLLDRINRHKHHGWHHHGWGHHGWDHHGWDHQGWHGHYPSWEKPKRYGYLRSFYRNFKLRWPITLRKGWGHPPPYYKWPTTVHSYAPSTGWGWGHKGHTTHSSPAVVTSHSGWIQDSPPSSGWGSDVHTYAESSSEYSAPAATYSGSSATVSSNPEEYSAPVGQDSGWVSGSPPSDWKSSSKKRRGTRTGPASPEAESREDSEETDFMTGMASTYKEIFGDWFSSFTNLLMKGGTKENNSTQNSTSTDSKPSVFQILNKRRIKDILEPYMESEAVLEQQFNKLDESDEASKEDKAKLYLHLREAYMQSLLDKLAIDSKDKIPEFVPMPADPEEFNATAAEPETTSEQAKVSTSKSESISVSQSSSVKSESSSRNKRSPVNERAQAEQEVKYIENLIGETREFFTLLSVFDQNACMQKLVCDVHTRVEEAKEEGSYDYNMISMFKLVNALLVGDYKGSSMKYREAAYYGEVNRSEELCQKRYRSCRHTSKDIIQMGQELE